MVCKYFASKNEISYNQLNQNGAINTCKHGFMKTNSAKLTLMLLSQEIVNMYLVNYLVWTILLYKKNI